ncbi:hypothetical protein [Streptomyces sioyaensis]|uniref:hypothetical protein n=1 Tax=Streptomyces sioyaensis TaxID=67364 RepID=UPI0037A4F12A
MWNWLASFLLATALAVTYLLQLSSEGEYGRPFGSKKSRFWSVTYVVVISAGSIAAGAVVSGHTGGAGPYLGLIVPGGMALSRSTKGKPTAAIKDLVERLNDLLLTVLMTRMSLDKQEWCLAKIDVNWSNAELVRVADWYTEQLTKMVKGQYFKRSATRSSRLSTLAGYYSEVVAASQGGPRKDSKQRRAAESGLQSIIGCAWAWGFHNMAEPPRAPGNMTAALKSPI